MNLNNKKDVVFLVLAGFFITNAIVAELIGGKLIEFFGTFVQSIGIVLWPVVFITTDLRFVKLSEMNVLSKSYRRKKDSTNQYYPLAICSVFYHR